MKCKVFEDGEWYSKEFKWDSLRRQTETRWFALSDSIDHYYRTWYKNDGDTSYVYIREDDGDLYTNKDYQFTDEFGSVVEVSEGYKNEILERVITTTIVFDKLGNKKEQKDVVFFKENRDTGALELSRTLKTVSSYTKYPLLN